MTYATSCGPTSDTGGRPGRSADVWASSARTRGFAPDPAATWAESWSGTTYAAPAAWSIQEERRPGWAGSSGRQAAPPPPTPRDPARAGQSGGEGQAGAADRPRPDTQPAQPVGQPVGAGVELGVADLLRA